MIGGDPRSIATAAIQTCVQTQSGLLEGDCLDSILEAAAVIGSSLAQGGKLLIFGNGGSASDASHIAAELVGRFQRERRAQPAISLSVDQSALTAIANDYGFERVFARQIEALGHTSDVALAISTSGRSVNVLAGVRSARDVGLHTIGLTGADGGDLASAVDVCVQVPADNTARIQESHILVAHVLCELIEQQLD